MGTAIMFQGTGSHVGKSLLAAALCRILFQDGVPVVPFKAQNMALNAYVTRDGGEMGWAQALQAWAAGVDPEVTMNPVLLKPTGHTASQVILCGRPVGNMSARHYHLEFNTRAWTMIQQCLEGYLRKYRVVVLEGAGSPVEVNLKHRDICNMRVARLVSAPVLLVADIDRGGALAAVVGTLELLDPEERDLVAGIIINKFRGDLDLLQPGLDFLTAKTGKPVLGVIPYLDQLLLPQEDSVALEQGERTTTPDGALDVAVIQVKYIANFTDFDALAGEVGVQVRYVQDPANLRRPDMIILPGSKNTIADLHHLKSCGMATAILELAGQGVPVAGICGGLQMLGHWVSDPQGLEGGGQVAGLGLLDLETDMEPEKVTLQVEAKTLGGSPFLETAVEPLQGYELHMGRTRRGQQVSPAFRIQRPDGVEELDGAVSSDGLIWGTYLHGLWDNDQFRFGVLAELRRRRGLPAGLVTSFQQRLEANLDRLALEVRQALDMQLVYRLLGLN